MQDIEKLIQNNNFEEFKTIFKQKTLNSHQKKLVLIKCLEYEHLDFINYMNSRACLNENEMLDTFKKNLQKEISAEKLTFFNVLNDFKLSEYVDKGFFRDLIFQQTPKTFNWFIEKFPITSFKHFREIAFFCLQKNRELELKPFETCMFDYKICYSVCLYAFELDKKSYFTSFLRSQVRQNNGILNNIKKHQNALFDNTIKHKQALTTLIQNLNSILIGSNKPLIKPTLSAEIIKAEKFHDFLIQEISMAFKEHLQINLPKSSKISKSQKI